MTFDASLIVLSLGVDVDFLFNSSLLNRVVNKRKTEQQTTKKVFYEEKSPDVYFFLIHGSSTWPCDENVVLVHPNELALSKVFDAG